MERFLSALARWAAATAAVLAAALAILGGAVLLYPAEALRTLSALGGAAAALLGIAVLAGLVRNVFRRR